MAEQKTSNRKAYPSDLTDEQWAVLEPLIPPAKRGGRPRTVNMREVVNGIFYVDRTGCQWDALPNDLPPKSTVHGYFNQWRLDGTWQMFLDTLRKAVRLQEKRQETSSLGCIDSQSVKTTEIGGERGYDGGKKIKGRKRHIVVDSLGLLMAVTVTSAALDDGKAAPLVLAKLKAADYPLAGDPGRQQIPQPSPQPLDESETGQLHDPDPQPPRRKQGLHAHQTALESGTHLRLAGTLSPAQQGL